MACRLSRSWLFSSRAKDKGAIISSPYGSRSNLTRSSHCSKSTAVRANLEVELKAPNGREWRQPLGIFINNEFVTSSNKQRLTTVNPATEEDICSVYSATADDVNKAVAAAKKAFRHESWRGLSGTERAVLMNKLVDLIEQNAELLATIETLDNGKPYRDSINVDVPMIAGVLRYYAGFADKIFGQTIDVGPSKVAYTIKEPLGVCGQIIPWNYPLGMAGWKLGPALACGNTVVLKLAEQTPLSVLYVGKLIREAGFPPGVVNILNGHGREAGAALVQHADVQKIAFTGSTATGKEIMRMAASTMKNITLETGGKSPMIVFDDADLDEAVKWAHMGIMSNMGQICSATSRILLQESIYATFVDKFKEQVERLSVIGDPFEEDTFQGPQITRSQYEKVLAYIEAAKEEGATIELGGKAASNKGRGFFIEPTLFTNVQPSMNIFREEIFGPCVALLSFRTEAEAVEVANDTIYGLGAAVFTQNLARGHRIARDVESGMVWVNSSNDSDHRVPFGGVKQSGIGRENGEAGLASYYNIKAVHVNLAKQ